MTTQIELENNLINECRICFEEEDINNANNPFISPCACKGTSKYVHKKCLDTWRNTNRGRDAYYKCMECNHEYIVYREYVREPIDLFYNNYGMLFFLFTSFNTLLTCSMVSIEYFGGANFNIINALNFGNTTTVLKQSFKKDFLGCIFFYYSFNLSTISILLKTYSHYYINYKINRTDIYYKNIRGTYISWWFISLFFYVLYYTWSEFPFSLITFLFFYDMLEYSMYYIFVERHNTVINRMNSFGIDELLSFDENPLDNSNNHNIIIPGPVPDNLSQSLSDVSLTDSDYSDYSYNSD